MGRRNLLTTASNGSANGLQVISDRLADNFSILPGHHGTGDNGDDDGEDNDGRVSGDDDDEAEEDNGDGDGGGIMSKTFAMFECGKEGAVTVGAHERWEGARTLSLSPYCVIHYLSTHTYTREQHSKVRPTLIYLLFFTVDY